MDEWIEQMRSVAHFCPPCQRKKEAGYRSALTVARAVRHRCRQAAAFLRDRLGRLPAPARPHVISAVEHYERIADLLAPAASPDAEQHYRTFIGDLDQQREHAAHVLRKAKAGLVAAADAMEKAGAAGQAENGSTTRRE
jgi:hypothetical protein